MKKVNILQDPLLSRSQLLVDTGTDQPKEHDACRKSPITFVQERVMKQTCTAVHNTAKQFLEHLQKKYKKYLSSLEEFSFPTRSPTTPCRIITKFINV